MEVTQNNLSAQIMFDFAQPIYFKKQINKKKSRLLLLFPGMKLKFFNSEYVIKKFNSLKKTGLVQNVKVYETEHNVPLVSVAITFNKYRTVKTKKSSQKIPNKLLIKWSKIEDPNRLILDIFTVETLNNIRKRNSIILQAHNTSAKPFFFEQNKQLHQHKKPRIVIDPGHGGLDPGAKSYTGTYEKDITLAIAKHVRSMLRKNGINALLTRSTDKYVPLVKRSELATQLQADLFVSVHVNSHQIPSNKISGIETFYLDSNKFLPPNGDCGFLSVNIDNQKSATKELCFNMYNVINTSKQLAKHIQQQLITNLKKKNYFPLNRGIKCSRDRLLLRSHAPAALVEVGFITNKKEASLLSNRKYQEYVAQGIYSGIKDTLKLCW